MLRGTFGGVLGELLRGFLELIFRVNLFFGVLPGFQVRDCQVEIRFPNLDYVELFVFILGAVFLDLFLDIDDRIQAFDLPFFDYQLNVILWVFVLEFRVVV